MRIILLGLFFLMSIYVPAQQAKQYAFKHFSVINGLASNTVSTVLQDRDGYLWIATVNGLQRYDGSSFITFKSSSSDPSSIPTNHIISIFEDRKNRLWLVGDNNRIGIFDTKKFVFREVSLPVEQRKFYIPQSFIEAPTGEFLLLKDDGSLLQYNEKNHSFVAAPDILPSPPRWERRAITWDGERKKYWMSCDSGIAVYDTRLKHLNYRGHNIDNDPVIKTLGHLIRPSQIFIDRKGNVIFNHWGYMAGGPTMRRYARQASHADTLYIHYPGYHEIFGWLQQRNGRLWTYGLHFFAEWIDDGT